MACRFSSFVRSLLAVSLLAAVPSALAQPSFVFHDPVQQVFGEPGGITMREPDVPREDEQLAMWIKTGPSFTYDQVAVYYTIDGSEPSGTQGVGTVGTLVLRSIGPSPAISFVRNEPGMSGNDDWWKANFNGLFQYRVGTVIKYKVAAWRNTPPVGEIQSATNTFTVKLAWPGAGAGAGSPHVGYPGVSFWKEEAVFGNTFCAGMLDRNGTVYDFHFPTVGGIYGVGTKNEGYVDGLDTFPPGLPLEWRGQMHLNQAMPGIRVDGLTHWLSNPNGVSFNSVQQAYLPESNTVVTSQTLPTDSGAGSIEIVQHDFSPIGVSFPLTPGNGGPAGEPIRQVHVKRMTLTYTGPAAEKSVAVYQYLDPALNGGDQYDFMFHDSARGVMCAYDKTTRTVTGTGPAFAPGDEYNPKTNSGYFKNVALYLGMGFKVTPDATPMTPDVATDSWRDTSGDNSQGWIGRRITLPADQPVEVTLCMVGGHFRPEPFTDPMPFSDGVYDNQIGPAFDWFYAQDANDLQSDTDAYWADWLDSGVVVDTPDDDVDRVFKRGLLATALHVDAVNGGVIAGFHNGAYPYVWPRDAAYAAITLARTGHLDESGEVYRYMREVCYRDFEPWGRLGFWKQKYSTDGFVIWGAPQIDETSAFPWGLYYQYLMTNDAAILSANVEQVRDSVQSMTRDSSDTRLRYEEGVNLVYSNNVWEDSYDTFIYSNASVARGLYDAASIFSALGLGAEAADAQSKADAIKAGLDARLDWNGENCDISQLGIVHPFALYDPKDSRVNLVVDRINGVANDTFGNNQPLVNFSGEHQDTINRYWGDGYWNGGPWFLTTLWYGQYFAHRQDHNPGTADIDNHYYRLNLMIDRLGPAGLGAEQIAYATGGGASLLYPGQPDFKLQTAWPNAWESMSTLADSVMQFIDFTPDAPNDTMHIEPKLPAAWSTMTFRGLRLRDVPGGQEHVVDAQVTNTASAVELTLDYLDGSGVKVAPVLRVPAGRSPCRVVFNGASRGYTFDAATGRLTLQSPLVLISGSNLLRVSHTGGLSPDRNQDGASDLADLIDFLSVWQPTVGLSGPGLPGDLNGDNFVDLADLVLFLEAWLPGCP